MNTFGGFFLIARTPTISTFLSILVGGKDSAKKSEFPFPLHFLNLFINKLPQDIRVVMHTLLNAVIGIDYNICQALAAGNTIVRDRRIDLFTVRALTGLQPRRIAVGIRSADAVRLEHR